MDRDKLKKDLKPYKICLAVFLVSLVLLVIGLFTPGWRQDDDADGGEKLYGLLSKPARESGSSTQSGGGTTCKSCECCNDSQEAAKVLVSLGVATTFCCAVYTAVYIFLRWKTAKEGIYQYFPVSNAIAAVVGGGLSIIGSFVYAGEFYGEASVHYSFFFAFFGSIVLIIGGLISFKVNQKFKMVCGPRNE